MDTRIAFALALSLLGVRLWAQDLPELQEVVVTATRSPTDLLDTPSFVTVVSAQDIQDSGASDVAGVLARESAVIVNDYGPDGSTKTLSIRGSTSSQVLVLVDGIRLNSSFDGWVDLSRIPLDTVDHIEIVRGGASSLWGTGAVGGVINVITKKAEGPAVSLSVTNGSYLPHDGYAVTETGQSPVPASAMSLVDNQRVALSAAGRLGNLALSAGGSFTRAMNAFLWDDTASLGAWRQRNNAQDLAEDAYLGASLPLLGGSLSVKGMFDHALIGVPGSITFVSSQATQEDTAAMGSFSWTTGRFFTDSLTLDLKGSYRYAAETYDNPLYPPASLHTTHTANLDLTQKLSISDAVTAVYGGSGSYELAQSSNLSGGNDRVTLAGFLSVPFSPVDVLTITPSVRYDYYSDFPGYLSYQLAAVWSVSDSASVKASAGTAYRAPTLSDLYWYSYDGAFFGDTYYSYGNPSLQPETSYSAEVGTAISGKVVSVEASAFARLLYNQINWGPYTASIPAPTVFIEMPVNISQSFLPGAEIHARLAVADWLSFQLNYTFIYSMLLQYQGTTYQPSDNLRVPFVPMHDADLVARVQLGAHSITAEVQYVSQKFIDAANTAAASLPGYFLVNAGYRFAAGENLDFSLALRNVLNTLYYTQSGYPMPPFSFVTGVEVRL